MPGEDVREVFRGKVIRVEVARWDDHEREVVRHQGAVAVVAMLDDRRVVLVRQLREALDEKILEVPAGKRDQPGEPPEETARREVREETGYRLMDVQPLGRIHSSPGFSDEEVLLFKGRAEHDGDPDPGEGEEGIEVVVMPLAEAVAAVRDGRITDAKSAVALLLTAGV